MWDGGGGVRWVSSRLWFSMSMHSVSLALNQIFRFSSSSPARPVVVVGFGWCVCLFRTGWRRDEVIYIWLVFLTRSHSNFQIQNTRLHPSALAQAPATQAHTSVASGLIPQFVVEFPFFSSAQSIGAERENRWKCGRNTFVRICNKYRISSLICHLFAFRSVVLCLVKLMLLPNMERQMGAEH